ncbi:DNA N-6-adenine-methyltransferase [Acidithiobacillus caldus]
MTTAEPGVNPSTLVLHIDPDLQRVIVPLSQEEREQLEHNLVSDGCRIPLVVWGNTIIDGHHRYEICTRLGIPFQTVEMDFPDKNAAKIWILRNQLGRRNLGDYQRAEVALQLEDMFREQARARQMATLKQNAAVDTVVENFPPREEPGKSRDAIASLANLSGRTIDKVKSIQRDAIEDVQEMARSGEISIHTAARIADLNEQEQAEIVEAIQAGEKPTDALRAVADPAWSDEWYTPDYILDAARAVLGDIDLDPASCTAANEAVQAKRFFAKEQDGLQQAWRGKVWLNPPYSYPAILDFCEAMVQRYIEGSVREAIVLVNSGTETQWGQMLLSHGSAACFPASRVKFRRPEGKSGLPSQGQMLVYFGPHVDRFKTVFLSIGAVMYGVQRGISRLEDVA